MELKVHRATWSGEHPQNSLAGLRECYRERVARVEIDFRTAGDDFVVTHDAPRRGAKLVPLSDAIAIVRSAAPGPTLLMLDAKDERPWTSAEVARLVRLIEPVRDRIFVGSPADWNLRRLRAADRDLALAFDPQYYLTWSARKETLPGRRGAYGYQDDHPLALRRTIATVDYLRERFEMLVGQVADVREVHIRVGFLERMLDDGFDAAGLIHRAGALMDVWTLDAGTRAWRTRLGRVLAGGADVVTSNTARELAEAASETERRA